jgi:hypothetical protein
MAEEVWDVVHALVVAPKWEERKAEKFIPPGYVSVATRPELYKWPQTDIGQR